MRTAEIVKRLAALEREMADLKAGRLSLGIVHPVEALEGIHGTFENDEAFKEAMSLGRKWRDSQRSNKLKGKAKTK